MRNKKLKLPSVAKKKVYLNSFLTKGNLASDESISDFGDVSLSYNFDVSDGTLKPGIGVSEYKPFSQTLKFDGDVTSIGESAFYRCSSLTDITIPNGVTTIGEGAFYRCISLTSIIIPKSVTSINVGAFERCEKLKSIELPTSVTTIAVGAFAHCRALRSITLPNSITSIENTTFTGCSLLKDITIPNSVTSIGIGVFKGCTTLKTITIPNSVTSIKNRAFSGCSSLNEVYCRAKTVPDMGEDVFKKISSSAKIYVPKESANAYKKASGWKKYANLIVSYNFG